MPFEGSFSIEITVPLFKSTLMTIFQSLSPFSICASPFVEIMNRNSLASVLEPVPKVALAGCASRKRRGLGAEGAYSSDYVTEA
jgi:hypothetical protein